MTRCMTSVVVIDAGRPRDRRRERGDDRLGELRLALHRAMARRSTSKTRSAVVRRWALAVTRRSRSSIHSTMAAASSASFDGK